MSPKYLAEHCRDTVIECAFQGTSFIDYMEGKQDAHFQVPAVRLTVVHSSVGFYIYENSGR